MGAVGEGVAIAAIGGIADLGAAGGAGGRIRDDPGMGGGCRARQDDEVPGPRELRKRLGVGDAGALDRIDPGQRGTFVAQSLQKGADRRGSVACRGEQANQNALAVVANIAAQAAFARQAPDGRSKPHALDETADPNRLGLCATARHGDSRQDWSGRAALRDRSAQGWRHVTDATA
jgi:hypothetical protein